MVPMFALVAALAIGSACPDIALAATDGKPVKLAAFSGRSVALITGLDLSTPGDNQLLAPLSLVSLSKEKLEIAVLSLLAPERLSALSESAGERVSLYSCGEDALTALDALVNGKPQRRCVLVNAKGRVVRVWSSLGPSFAESLADWFSGRLVPYGYPCPDPRAPFGIEPGESDRGLLLLFLSSIGVVDAMYADRIVKLANFCAERKISIVALFPSYDETEKTVAKFAKAAMFEFPCVVDPGFGFADALRITHTPTAVLLARDGKCAYAGAIDSNTRDRETNRKYVQDAIEALLKGEKPPIVQTMPFGTLLRRSERDDQERIRGSGGGGAVSSSP